MIDRHTIRQIIRNKRKELPLVIQHQAARMVSQTIAQTAWFQNSQSLAFYCSIHGELDALPLMELAWEQGKICYLPVCHLSVPNTLCFLPHYPSEPLKPNQYGILEPSVTSHPPTAAEKLDLVFTPLVAFDRQGNRLGSGKGYYDRTFAFLQKTSAKSKPVLIGLSYAFQEVENLLPNSWDIPLEKVVAFDTESQAVRIYEFPSSTDHTLE